MNVRELMTAAVVTCTEDEPLAEAAKLIAVHRLRGVPVVEDGAVVGTIGPQDLQAAFEKGAGALRWLKVGAVMSHDVAVARPDDPLASALRLMRKRGLDQLPIVDAEGMLVGLLTLDELLRHRAALADPEALRDLDTLASAAPHRLGPPRPSR